MTRAHAPAFTYKPRAVTSDKLDAILQVDKEEEEVLGFGKGPRRRWGDVVDCRTGRVREGEQHRDALWWISARMVAGSSFEVRLCAGASFIALDICVPPAVHFSPCVSKNLGGYGSNYDFLRGYHRMSITNPFCAGSQFKLDKGWWANHDAAYMAISFKFAMLHFSLPWRAM